MTKLLPAHLLVSLLLTPLAWSARITLDFDSIIVPSGTFVDATSYLSNEGILFTPVTPNVHPVLINASLSGPGQSAAIPTSPPNVFNVDVPGLGPGNVSYELEFESPVADVIFSRTAIISISGIPPWSVTAFNAAGDVISSYSEGQQIGPAAQTVSLLGSGIARLRFDALNGISQTTFNTPPLDNLQFTTTSTVPEPSGVSLLSMGLVALCACRFLPRIGRKGY